MNFTVYRSSAGSGKTFTLVKEYLKLALSDKHLHPQKYRHILAITFTNKAAAEMKERIIKALKELAENNHPGPAAAMLRDRLKEELMLSEDAIRERAARVLEAILHNYSDFAIGTIDSFVHKIIRTFAFDLKIPLNFEIETDTERLLAQAIDLLLSRIGHDEKLTQALVAFAEYKAEEEKNWNIEKDLQQMALHIFKEEGIPHLQKLRQLSLDDFFKIRDNIQSEIRKTENAILKIATDASSLIAQKGLETSSFYRGRTGIATYFNNLSKAQFEKILPNTYVTETVHENKWYAGKISDSEKIAIDSVKKELAIAYEQLQHIISEKHPLYQLLKLINRDIYSLAVLSEIEKLLNRIKIQNNILHISEFNAVISKIVFEQPVPFIYERIGEKYHHYLIDEFQDTSILQWQNLLPLMDNALSENHFNMIVGDGKQSIYRWRGGEVEQFSNLPQVYGHEKNPFIEEREDTLKRNYNPRHLNKNFRSKAEIIRFNNALFRCLSEKLSEKYKNIYQDLEQEFDSKNLGGHVSITFVQGEKELYKLNTLQKIYATVHKALADHFTLKDIAILTRRNSELALIASFLTARGIRVISSESLLLKNASEVNFIVSIFQYLKSPKNDIAKVEIIRYLVKNNHIREEQFHDAVLEARGLEFSFDKVLKRYGFDFSSENLLKRPLYELTEMLIGTFNLSEINSPYLCAFLDEVLQYTVTVNNNLSDFLDWWEHAREKACIVIPEGLDAVTLMTIHRSKGLEFPVVIFPFASWKVVNGKDRVWIDVEEEIRDLPAALLPASSSLEATAYASVYMDEKDKSLLDNLNVLYVALTRPEKRLYILSSETVYSGKCNTISDMLCHYLVQRGDWNSAQCTYTFGDEDCNETGQSPLLEDHVVLSSSRSNDWRSTVKIKADASEIWDTEETEKKKNYGLLIHKALSAIRCYDETEIAIDALLAEGLIDREEKHNLALVLNRLVHHPQLRPHFERGLNLKLEAELLLPDGTRYRPDRVIIGTDSTVIIDFKTGKPLESHKNQVNTYASVLKDMGASSVLKYLVYIDEERIEGVP